MRPHVCPEKEKVERCFAVKKMLSFLLALAMLLSLAAVPAAAEEEMIGPFERYPETIHVKAANRYVDRLYDDGFTKAQGLSKSGNLYCDLLLERSNIEVEYIWNVDSKTYNTKIALGITSGDLPDIFYVEGEQVLKMLVENDMIEPMDQAYETKAAQYIKDFYADYDDPFAVATFDGKLMAIPDINPGYEFNFVWVRKDWLDRLNLELPTTAEDCVAIAQAFIDNDMSGRGDMLGFPCSNDVAGKYNKAFSLDPILNTMGAYPRSWIYQEDGSIAYGTIQPEVREGLLYLADLYQRGLIDREFAVRDGDAIKELIATGRIGIAFGAWYLPDVYMKNMKAIDPDSEWIPVLAPLGDDGKIHPIEQQVHRYFLCVRKGYEHPEVALELMNYAWVRGSDPEIAAINTFYNENMPSGKKVLEPYKFAQQITVQWNDAVAREGKAVMDAIEHDFDATGLSSELTKFLNASRAYLVDGDVSQWYIYAARVLGCAAAADKEKIEVRHVCYPSFTETMALKWASLSAMEDEMILKVVMGEESIEAFDTFVENWRKLGGDEITEEINEMYAGN